MPSLGLGLGTNRINPLFRGLLNQYSGAAAAYSLEKLSSGTNNVVRVRRSSDDAESDFTAQQVSDGTLTTWTGANDGYVVTWYDQSGNSNDASQATAALQPKIVSAGSLIAGGIDFRESASTGLGHFDLSLAVTQPNIFAVFRRSDLIATSFVHLIDNPDFSTVHFTATDYVRFLSASFYSDSVTYNTDGSDNLVSSINQTTAQGGSSLHVNGSSVTLATTDVNSSMTIATIGGSNAWGNSVNQIMRELIIYDSDQSANRAGIEANINGRYSIY